MSIQIARVAVRVRAIGIVLGVSLGIASCGGSDTTAFDGDTSCKQYNLALTDSGLATAREKYIAKVSEAYAGPRLGDLLANLSASCRQVVNENLDQATRRAVQSIGGEYRGVPGA